MSGKTSVFVYEYLTGSDAGAGDPEAAALMPMGWAMRDALAADLLAAPGLRVSVAGAAHAPAPPPNASRVAPLPGETAVEFVARQAAAHDVAWIIAPETGGLLARFARSVDRTRWLGCEPGAIDLTASKRATALRLAGRGVATPLGFEHAPGVTRWIVKPDDGAGSTGARVHARRESAWHDCAARSRAGQALIVEPWVDGEALSLSLLCSEAGAELLSVNRQQVEVGADGAVAYRGVQVAALARDDERLPLLQLLATRIGRGIAGLRGYVGVDLVWHAQRGPVVVELNPRVTCAYVGLSAALRRNVAAEWVGERCRLLEPADATL